MTKLKKSRLIVVLGMHRSGTSVITRGLQVLGVSLGETLIQPIAGVNDKGFFEDVDINAFNAEMLHAIESDWFYSTAIGLSHIDYLRVHGYILRAVDLLKSKMQGFSIFGLKDPRIAKLLPFWNEVIDHLSLNVNYVIALRNPLSVVRSLEKRDDLIAEQGYFLWLSYILESLRGSAGKPVLMVDYDRLMQNPDYELSRIANAFNLKVSTKELDTYKNEFIDSKLRHTTYNQNDLLLDAACPPIVCEVFDKLSLVVSDQLQFDAPALLNDIDKWTIEFNRLALTLSLADKQNCKIANLRQAVIERDTKIAEFDAKIAERDAKIAERDAKIAEFDRNLEAVHTSTSWRITKPLREIKKFLQGNNS